MFPNNEDKQLLRESHPITQLTCEEKDPMTHPMNCEKDFPIFSSPFFYASDKIVPVEVHAHLARPVREPNAHLNPRHVKRVGWAGGGRIAYARPGTILFKRVKNKKIRVDLQRIESAVLITDIKHDMLSSDVVEYTHLTHPSHT